MGDRDDRHDLREVLDMELQLLDPAVRTDRAVLEQLLHPDFAEFGASGRVWDREAMMRALGEEAPVSRTEVSDLAAAHLADDVILVTYRTTTAERSALRSSTWVQARGRWQVRFHQGTPLTG
jgi:ribonuclease HI